MKLFQWVHRKLRQSSIDPLKEFTLRNPCTCLTVQPTVDNQYSHTRPSFSSVNQPSFSSQTCYSGFDNNREEDNSHEETPAVNYELFEGFLTIGTLGAETVTNEPATPTFTMPLEDMTKTNAKVSENDLKLISYELEKFLVAEKEQSFYESSGRNSHVSTITLSGKQIAGSEAEDYGNKTLCPLQGYLLRSSIELPETTDVKKERASLGELFHRTKTTSQDCTETGVRAETQVKQTHKSAMHIMRKMLKKAHSSSKSCNTSGDDAVSASTNKKLHKVLRMFHRKVHPESSMNSKDSIKSHKGKINNVPDDCCHEYDDGDPTNPEKSRFHSDTKSRKWSQHCKTNWKPIQDGVSCSSSTGNNEHWIKTDAEYLVLEL